MLSVSEEDKSKEPEKIFEEITAKNFPKMGKEIAIQVQKAQRVQYRINSRKNTRYILIKLTKIKHKKTNIKSSKGKATKNIQGDPHTDKS